MARSFDVESFEIKGFQAAFGGQDYLRFGITVKPSSQATDAPWPAFGNGIFDALQSERVIDLGTTPVTGNPPVALPSLTAGTYYCAFPMSGMAAIYLFLNFTFTGGTLTANAFSTYKDHFTQYQSFTNNGALTTATQAVLSLSTPHGEQIGLLQLVVGTGATVSACSQAEYSGQRG